MQAPFYDDFSGNSYVLLCEAYELTTSEKMIVFQESQGRRRIWACSEDELREHLHIPSASRLVFDKKSFHHILYSNDKTIALHREQKYQKIEIFQGRDGTIYANIQRPAVFFSNQLYVDQPPCALKK